jgi:predicted GIY-YIG superfamily endonuclease
MNMLHFVYELIDPRTNAVGYVGITDNPNRRFLAHLGDTETNHRKQRWMRQLQSEGLEPRMRILEVLETKEEALEREKHWIQYHIRQGAQLTNIMNAARARKRLSKPE